MTTIPINGKEDTNGELEVLPDADMNVSPPRRPGTTAGRLDFIGTGPMRGESAFSLESSPDRFHLMHGKMSSTDKLNDSMMSKPSFIGERDNNYVLEKLPKRKQLKKLTSIEQAKDRAQITAATAMSIVHVALLKDVLDAGPIGNAYYKWSLGFILTALILQILAGFISLYIALLRYYYTEYKDDFLDDCIKTCCPWRCRRKKHKHNDSLKSWMNKPKKNKKLSKSEVDCEDDDCEDSQSCCPFECTTMRFAEFEYQVLDLYDTMSEEVIRADLQCANFEMETQWLVEKVTRLNNELQKYESIDVNDEDANKEYLQSIREQLQEAQKKREDMEERNRKAKSLRAQGEILEDHVEAIQEERVLKRTTFWQNWLNMMLYTVFILNAVIAGIGLANPSHQNIVGSETNVTSR